MYFLRNALWWHTVWRYAGRQISASIVPVDTEQPLWPATAGAMAEGRSPAAVTGIQPTVSLVHSRCCWRFPGLRVILHRIPRVYITGIEFRGVVVAIISISRPVLPVASPILICLAGSCQRAPSTAATSSVPLPYTGGTWLPFGCSDRNRYAHRVLVHVRRPRFYFNQLSRRSHDAGFSVIANVQRTVHCTPNIRQGSVGSITH